MINIKTGWLNSVFMVSIGFSVLAQDRPQMSQPKGPRRNRALTPIFSLEDADAPGCLADRDVLDAGVLGGVDDRYAVRSAVRDELARRDVDDVELVVVLGADVDEAGVGREHRILGVVPVDLDPEDDRVARGIDESDAVGELDRGGDKAAVGRDIDPLGRLAE